jgi:DNA adenine methylase
MNSPIKHYDGKGIAQSDILSNFPSDGTYDTYLEVFGGGTSLVLRKPPNTPTEIYNDLDENVYSLFSVMSDAHLFNIFKEKCDLTYYSEQLRREFVQSLKRDNLSIVDRAYKYFIVNRTSDNGIGGFSISPLVRRNMSKSVSDMLATISNLPQIHQRLSRVIVTNRDAFEMMADYDSENVFVYADLPQHRHRKVSTRYKVDMTDEQRKGFVDRIVNSKSKVLVCGYNGEECEKLNSSENWIRVDFDVGKEKLKTRTESLWKNYRSSNNKLFEQL